MTETIFIGSAPADEPGVCVETGVRYVQAMRRECELYLLAIRRVYGPEPAGARLEVRRQEHDFGPYYEVVCAYDDGEPLAAEYAAATEVGLDNWAQAGLTVTNRRDGDTIVLEHTDSRRFSYCRGLDGLDGICRVHVDASAEKPSLRLERGPTIKGPWEPFDFAGLPAPTQQTLLEDAEASAGARV